MTRTEIAASEPLTVSVPEAAQMLGISRTYAFQLAREGRLPGAFRIGGRVLVSRQVLERLLAGGADAEHLAEVVADTIGRLHRAGRADIARPLEAALARLGRSR